MRIDVDELFHEVADLSAEARAQYFREHGIGTATRQEIEALLKFDSGVSDSLDTDITQVAEFALRRLESQDKLCGPYKVGELLGRGGMGSVYLAERIDGEVTHQAAVKLLRPGADDPQIRQRFLAERQILASLSHPNIATLLDAGHREDGQPYLVMEYVEGKPIDLYTANLGTRQKIGLFVKVCAAVSYLHRNLIVHRDLKPANILVTDQGEPKLLDFGIAKMLDLSTDLTQTSMRMLTPDYASPEQVTGSPITTASDIYSLGAVLYKLLTGSSPHESEGDSVGVIVAAIFSGRIKPPSSLVPALRGDLESIIMKALRPEPQERYATVEQFAEDLDNFLESRPIRPRKGDAWYRTRKLLRRHWLPAAAAALAIGGLAGGVLVANHQRSIAQRRFVQVRQLSNKLFDIDTEVRQLTGSTKTRQLIVDASLDYLQRLSADAEGDPQLAVELGNAYMRVARVQGVPISQNLGQMGKADQNLRIAEQFLRSALAADPKNRIALLRSAQVAHDRMLLARFGGASEDALKFARESAAWLEKFHAGIGDKAESSAILITYLNVADQHMLGRQFDEALLLCQQGIDLAHIFKSVTYPGTFFWVSGDVFRRQGDLEKALRATKEAVRILEPASLSAEHGRVMNFVLALIREGEILGEDKGINLGRREEAATVLQRAFDISDTFVHQDSKDETSRGRLASAGITLADTLRRGEPRRALAIYDHVLGHMAEIGGNTSFRRFEVNALAGSSIALMGLGRSEDAHARLNDAFGRLRQLKMYPAEKIKPGSEPDIALSALAEYDASRGDISAAIEIYQKLLQQVLAGGAKPDASLQDAVEVSRLYAALAALHSRAHQADLASAVEAQRLQLWRHWDVQLPHNSFINGQLSAANRSVG